MKTQSALINNKRTYGFSSEVELLNFIEDKKNILIALNAEKLMNDNTELNDIINTNIGYPDGIGAVFALKKKGIKSKKIAGADLWLHIVNEFQDSKSFYLIGGKPNIIQNTVSKLKTEFPKIKLLGYRDGFLKKGDEEKLVQDLLEKKPDVVFVAMGSPKQELLMKSFIQEHKALYMGLGGSFDVYTGLKKRAPEIYQKLGLEWLHRLFIEPTRWRRQLVYFTFLFKLVFNKI